MKERNAVILLFFAPLIWGFAFVFQSLASGKIGDLYFTSIRMFIGFIVLLPFMIKIVKRHDKQYFKRLIISGILCGIPLSLATSIQQFGIAYTTVGKAGFITSLYTLFVPIISLLRGQKISKKIWFCVGIAIIGAYLLCASGETGITKGDLIILSCAVFFAIQITVLDITVKNLEGLDLSAVQFFVTSLITFIFAFFTESITAQQIKITIIPILYAGVFSCGLAYTFQTIGQKYVSPTKATLILSLESAWSAIGGALILHQYLTFKELIGCAMIFFAVIISQ